MLRRNFLKLLGLIPFIAVPKPATGGLIGKGPKIPIHAPEIPSPKWYVIVSISKTYSTELELTDDCIPKVGEIAYLMLDGRVGDSIRRTYKYPIHIGVFLTGRYQKNV